MRDCVCVRSRVRVCVSIGTLIRVRISIGTRITMNSRIRMSMCISIGMGMSITIYTIHLYLFPERSFFKLLAPEACLRFISGCFVCVRCCLMALFCFCFAKGLRIRWSVIHTNIDRKSKVVWPGLAV